MGDVQVRVNGLKRYEREMQGEGQGWLIVPRLRLGGFRDRRLLCCVNCSCCYLAICV